MEQLQYRLIGSSPLLLHNGQLANPLNQFTRDLNLLSKKGRGMKDVEHLEQIARLEFLGSLYTNGKGRIGIPANVIFTVVRNGARKFKAGKSIEAGLVVKDFAYLEYDGPEDPEELFEFTNDLGIRPFVDQRMVGIQRNKVLRTRPIFSEWILPISIYVEPNVIQEEAIREYVDTAGILLGIGDGRSLGYGRFEVE